MRMFWIIYGSCGFLCGLLGTASVARWVEEFQEEDGGKVLRRPRPAMDIALGVVFVVVAMFWPLWGLGNLAVRLHPIPIPSGTMIHREPYTSLLSVLALLVLVVGFLVLVTRGVQ